MKITEEVIRDWVEESKKYKPCMSLNISTDGQYVELLLDTSLRTYHEWIPNCGGADMGLIREDGTDRIVGIQLPLLNPLLGIHYDGPIKINEGFLKSEWGE